MSVYDKLKELNITLPPVAVPAAAYVPYVQTGNLVFLSGHIARKDGKPWAAQFGRDITTEEGKAAARAVAVDLLGTLHAATGGDLNRVQRIVKVMSLVNSTGDYTEQHLVTNGASELLGEVFGDKGKHARSAFGVAQIPMGACVEIELIAELAYAAHRVLSQPPACARRGMREVKEPALRARVASKAPRQRKACDRTRIRRTPNRPHHLGPVPQAVRRRQVQQPHAGGPPHAAPAPVPALPPRGARRVPCPQVPPAWDVPVERPARGVRLTAQQLPRHRCGMLPPRA